METGISCAAHCKWATIDNPSVGGLNNMYLGLTLEDDFTLQIDQYVVDRAIPQVPWVIEKVLVYGKHIWNKNC